MKIPETGLGLHYCNDRGLCHDLVMMSRASLGQSRLPRDQGHFRQGTLLLRDHVMRNGGLWQAC